MPRNSSNSSVSSISSYKSTNSFKSASSTLSTMTDKARSLKVSVKAMKRIKGHLSKKFTKGQKFASNMVISSSKRRSRDMSVIEEDSVIDEGSVDTMDFNMDLPMTLELECSGVEVSGISSTPYYCNNSTISEDGEDIIYTERIRDESSNEEEILDLTPRMNNTVIGTGASSLGIENNDLIEDEMVIECTVMPPPSSASLNRIQYRRSFCFDDDTISLTSFQTVRTLERLIHNPNAGLIFLLLLQIKTKKFEIIQIPLPSSTTIPWTIGDILHHIAIRATDPILAKQRYHGLCRPSNGIRMDPSASAIDEDGECRILCGEVLVPIPEKHCGAECMLASQYVLNLQAVDDLFQRMNPLTPTKISCGDSIGTNEVFRPQSRSDKLENECFSPVGIELEYSQDHSTEGSSDTAVKLSDAFDTMKDDEALSYADNMTKVDDINKNVVEVVLPEEKMPSLGDLLEFPSRTLRIYEQHLIRLVQKQISMNSQQDSRFCARVIVKGSKCVIIFLIVRRIIVGTRSTNSGVPTSMTRAKSSDQLGVFSLVEFIMFLSFLIWYQKRGGRIQKEVLRSSGPRKIELWA